MHARHRSPGNGYRSGSMSMGLSASRISPESSVRGHGLYNSEYRSFNRGFGRCQGQPKSFPPPSTPPRRSTGGDIFMEAGRLAAEYLVSQGFLAPSVLSGKWQNGSLKNQAGELQEFRSHDNENLHLPPPDVRPSALSRLGNSVSDAGLGRRRYVDDYSSTGSRSHLKGRRQGGSFRYGSDFGREYGRSGSWSERNRGSSDVEGDDDTIPAHHEEQPVGKDVGSGIQKPSSGELATKVEEAGESETELDKNNFQDETRSSCIGKDSPHDGEVSTKPENSPVELKNENDENQKLVAVEGETPQPEEGDSSGKKNVTDLLTLCKFPNLRTKTRSALMVKGSRSDSVSNRVGTTSDVKPLVEEDPLNNSSRDLLSNKNHDLQLPDCDNSKALSVPEYGGVLVPEEDAEQAKCHSYQSFPNRVLVDDNEQEEDQGLTGLIRSTSMIQERGEKRAAEENDLREVAKRQREWLPSVASKSDECFSIPSVNEKEETPEEEKPSQSEEVTMAVDHGSLVNNHRIPVGGDEPCIQDAQEKQLFPSSFKICDLNLVGVADLNQSSSNQQRMEAFSSSPLSLHSCCVFSRSHRFDPCLPFHSFNGAVSSSISFGFSISQKTHPRLSHNFPSVKHSHSRGRRKFLPVSAVFERFTERAIKAVIFSQKEAKAFGKDMVFTQHLLLGLIAEDRDPRGFLGCGLTIDKAREAVRSIWHQHHHQEGDNSVSSSSPEQSVASSSKSTDVPFSISTKRVFEAAVEYSRTMGHHFIGPEHIAIGLLTVDDGSATRVLKRLGANVNNLAAAALSRLQGELAKDGREPSVASKGSFPGKVSGTRTSERTKEKNALAQFCVDLTARASEGLIDPVIGRLTEVQRIIQILCRRTKNNPILLGEAGVGKTAIAEGLAISIARADAPVSLLGKRVMSLDIGLLMAGAKERGELESRVTSLLNEIKKSGDVILFIDEVHTLVGSGTVGRGNKGSGLDIANLLKPSLGRGELQCIASTTLAEYRTQFETDKALARRFQPVLINEPSEEDAVRILLGLREKYETHHNCTYTLEAINAAVYLSSRYIPDRYLPDKAIDLIDEAGSRARIEAFKKKKEQQTGILAKPPDDYWQEIRTVQAMQEVVLASRLKHDGSASSIDDTSELVLDSPLPSTSDDDEPMVVGPEDIAAVASAWSGIPVQQLTVDERMLLVELDEQLKKRIIGQDEAVAAISRAVKRSRVGLKDPDRPVAAMLFCGPTGVGKTELTKALASCYFGSEEAMLRLDMSEYMERHTVSKLIGSPPGYVGHEEGGMLTEAIRRRPFTLLLLDEIEKAHPDVFNILLQLFEDGHLTDSQGRRVSFKNALIVMTSNVGSSAIAKGRRGAIGFLLADDESTSYAGMKALVVEELKTYFRPELLNRIDEIVVFQSLEKTQMLEILNLMLQAVKARLVSLGVGLEVSDSVKDLICQQGYDQTYGARPLRRAVTQMVEDLLSEALLAGNFKPGDTAVIDLDATGNPVVKNKSDRSIPLPDTTSIF